MYELCILKVVPVGMLQVISMPHYFLPSVGLALEISLALSQDLFFCRWRNLDDAVALIQIPYGRE